MGPLFFRAENESHPIVSWSNPERFNGAALFQSGERHFACWTVGCAMKLQWGRSFSERRTFDRRRANHSRRCFNGAALFQSGEPEFRSIKFGPWTSFNGAALFQSGERAFWRGAWRCHSQASMGPLFFRAENCVLGGRGIAVAAASMGPLFFRAENNVRPTPCFFASRLLQWGRSFSERRTSFPAVFLDNAAKGFNGAALFQSGEHGLAIRFIKNPSASMGPLFFRAENDLLDRRPIDDRLASMGPLFFRAENEPIEVRWHLDHEASMGPLFFRAENPGGVEVVVSLD